MNNGIPNKVAAATESVEKTKKEILVASVLGFQKKLEDAKRIMEKENSGSEMKSNIAPLTKLSVSISGAINSFSEEQLSKLETQLEKVKTAIVELDSNLPEVANELDNEIQDILDLAA